MVKLLVEEPSTSSLGSGRQLALMLSINPVFVHQQPSIRKFLLGTKPMSMKRTEKLDDQLVLMIAKGCHPLRLVEEKEFRKFVELLCPGYKLTTRKALSESLLPKVYNKMLELHREQISKALAVCITTG